MRKIYVLVSVAFLFTNPAFASLPKFSLRMMAANISSGTKQSYDNGEGIRIFQGLKPDVVMIQEFNYGDNKDAALAAFVESAFGPDFHYYRESEATDQIPNGIISRYPILCSGEWEDEKMPNRDFAWARIDIPGRRDLWVVSVHLHSSKVHVRQYEAEVLKTKMRDLVPENDYLALGGDFNIASRTDKTIETLKEVVSEMNPPVDSNGKTETNMKQNKNYDWLLVDSDLQRTQSPVRFRAEDGVFVESQNLFSYGLVFNSESFPRLDLVQPIQAGDSKAPGMQHFAVIKNFAIPIEPEYPFDEMDRTCPIEP